MICSIEPGNIIRKEIKAEYEKFIEFIQKEFKVEGDRPHFYRVYAEVKE